MKQASRAGRRFAMGLDFGTESVRALVVDCDNGREVAEAVSAYAHGVISKRLPGSVTPLPPEFALQHPGDYMKSMLTVIRDVLKKVHASTIVGIGVDFTACTMLPVLKDGTPLMMLKPFRGNPHAWPKLWKHHAAQAEADRINEVAHERGEAFLKYYSGIIFNEWMLPKCWEIARKAPDVYRAADLLVDAGDWLVFQLTGCFVRNSCAAGYKGMWNSELGFPSKPFLSALDPALVDLENKWLATIVAPGVRAGGITEAFARKSGLKAGTPVSAATIDAHSGVPGMGVSGEGPMSIIMGTSSCHMLLSKKLHLFEGYAGVVKDGIIPGFYGYESGQSAVGDIFGWYAKDFLGVPFKTLSARARRLKPGQSGVIALDWMNGCRSVLMNGRLSGMLAGLTLHTRPEEIYRALIEATAFGTRVIVESYRGKRIPVTQLVACGGLTKDPLIMQIYADVTGLPVKVAASGQAVALGSAIFGAMAAGAHASCAKAIAAMTRSPVATYQPDPSARKIYNQLFPLYMRCYEFFGREEPRLMSELKNVRTAMVQQTGKKMTSTEKHSF
jgi:L-ribulokinase